MALKPGTRIEVAGRGMNFQRTWRPAAIAAWRQSVNGPRMVGWHIVKFDDGGRLCINESNFRVIHNCEAALGHQDAAAQTAREDQDIAAHLAEQ